MDSLASSPIQDIYIRLQYNANYQACTGSVLVISSIAIFILGALAIAQIVHGSTVGWTTVGLAAGIFFLRLAKGRLGGQQSKLFALALIVTTLVVVGALGGSGILDTGKMGWAIVGTGLTLIGLSILFLGYNSIKNPPICRPPTRKN